MTKFIATSVVRGSHQGESHGGVYIVDMENRHVEQPIDWNTMDIDWQGRGWDRGLRGIAFDNEKIYIAASDELFVYSPDFRLLASYRNPYLKHCHEISVFGRHLFITSTGFDSILGFDLDKEKFTLGLFLATDGLSVKVGRYDPEDDKGPLFMNKLHINSVYCDDGGMYISGLRSKGLFIFNGKDVGQFTTLPEGTHNARPFRDGILFNDTNANAVRYVTPSGETTFAVPDYDASLLENTDLDTSKIARPRFGRGLCTVSDTLIAAGSSPSTIALHDISEERTIGTLALSMDIRNAIHGLEVWPFD